MARTRIISSSEQGQPGAPVPQRDWALKPIRLFRQRPIQRKMVNDLADGATQPEFRTLLGGISLRTRNVKRRFQNPQVPPRPNAGYIVVRTQPKRVKRLP